MTTQKERIVWTADTLREAADLAVGDFALMRPKVLYQMAADIDFVFGQQRKAEREREAAKALWNQCGSELQEVLDHIRALANDEALQADTIRMALRDLLAARDRP